MQTMKFLFAAACILFCSSSALAESLSADAVFAGSETHATVDNQSAEQKLERTRKLFADKEQGIDTKPAAAAWKTEPNPSLASSGFKMLQGLGICVGILLVGLHFFRKYNPQSTSRSSGRSMRVIERIAIGPKTSLVLADVEGRKVLIAVGNEQVSFYPHETQDELGSHFDNSLDLLCQDDVKTSDA